MEKNNKARFYTLATMILAAALSRFMPHPPNFTPIMAMAIFGGAFFTDKKSAFAVPIAAMLLTDIFLGFHSSMWAVYISFGIGVVMGAYFLKQKSFTRITTVSIASAVIFYLLTNFSCWLSFGMYPHTFAGLMQCYFMGLPFLSYTPMELFGFSLLSDLFYAYILFGAFAYAEKRIPNLAVQK